MTKSTQESAHKTGKPRSMKFSEPARKIFKDKGITPLSDEAKEALHSMFKGLGLQLVGSAYEMSLVAKRKTIKAQDMIAAVRLHSAGSSKGFQKNMDRDINVSVKRYNDSKPQKKVQKAQKKK